MSRAKIERKLFEQPREIITEYFEHAQKLLELDAIEQAYYVSVFVNSVIINKGSIVIKFRCPKLEQASTGVRAIVYRCG